MTLEIILFAIFALMQVGDIATTLHILGYGGYEANPVMSKAFEIFGSPAVGLIVIKGAIVGIVWTLLSLIGVWALFIMIAIYAAVLANNISVIRQHAAKP